MPSNTFPLRHSDFSQDPTAFGASLALWQRSASYKQEPNIKIATALRPSSQTAGTALATSCNIRYVTRCCLGKRLQAFKKSGRPTRSLSNQSNSMKTDGTTRTLPHAPTSRPHKGLPGLPHEARQQVQGEDHVSPGAPCADLFLEGLQL